jgi:hypothetical protein
MTKINLDDAQKQEGVDVVTFRGESFAMLVSALGAYSHGDEVDFRPKKDGSKTLATSLITDEFMGHYSRQDQELVLLGYTQIPDDSLYLCGPQDLCSLRDDGTYQRRERFMGVNYMPTRQMARQTSSTYNEYAMLRTNSQGEDILPTCVISFDSEIDEKSIEFAKKHNLPVVVIDWKEYRNTQLQKILDFEKKENPTPEEFESYLYGVTAFCIEECCYDLSKSDVSWQDCFDNIRERFDLIQSKLSIDDNSPYKAVCDDFMSFQRSTRNDAMGRIFVNDIFKEKSHEEAMQM